MQSKVLAAISERRLRAVEARDTYFDASPCDPDRSSQVAIGVSDAFNQVIGTVISSSCSRKEVAPLIAPGETDLIVDARKISNLHTVYIYTYIRNRDIHTRTEIYRKRKVPPFSLLHIRSCSL